MRRRNREQLGSIEDRLYTCSVDVMDQRNHIKRLREEFEALVDALNMYRKPQGSVIFEKRKDVETALNHLIA